MNAKQRLAILGFTMFLTLVTTKAQAATAKEYKLTLGGTCPTSISLEHKRPSKCLILDKAQVGNQCDLSVVCLVESKKKEPK
jgi:hypothetical protein